jgi:hypothetical protein
MSATHAGSKPHQGDAGRLPTAILHGMIRGPESMLSPFARRTQW